MRFALVGAILMCTATRVVHAQGAQATCANVVAPVPGSPPPPDPFIARQLEGAMAYARQCANGNPARARALIDPSATTTSLSPVSSLQLSASTDKNAKTVKARLGVLNGDGKGSSLAGTITLEGPLDPSGDRSTLLDVTNLTSLPNATTAGLSLHWYNWTPSLDTARFRAYCDRIKPLTQARSEPGQNIAWCFAGSDKVPAQFNDSLASFITDVGMPITMEVNARYGRQDVKYADAKTLGDSTVHASPYSIGAAIGYFFIPQATVFALSYDRVHSTITGKPTQLCVPVAAVSSALTCRTTTLGAPAMADGNVLGAELRRTFAPGIGVGVRLQEDFIARVQSVEVPLYFLGTTTTAPSGGVVLGWSTQHHQVSLTAFVGAIASTLTTAPTP